MAKDKQPVIADPLKKKRKRVDDNAEASSLGLRSAVIPPELGVKTPSKSKSRTKTDDVTIAANIIPVNVNPLVKPTTSRPLQAPLPASAFVPNFSLPNKKGVIMKIDQALDDIVKGCTLAMNVTLPGDMNSLREEKNKNLLNDCALSSIYNAACRLKDVVEREETWRRDLNKARKDLEAANKEIESLKQGKNSSDEKLLVAIEDKNTVSAELKKTKTALETVKVYANNNADASAKWKTHVDGINGLFHWFFKERVFDSSESLEAIEDNMKEYYIAQCIRPAYFFPPPSEDSEGEA